MRQPLKITMFVQSVSVVALQSRTLDTRRDERQDCWFFDVHEEIKHEQDISVRAERATVRVVDLSSFRPNFEEQDERPEAFVNHGVRQQQPRILER